MPKTSIYCCSYDCAFLVYSLSTRGFSVSSTETSILTEYIRFLLHGTKVISHTNQHDWQHDCIQHSFIVAIAVKAITWIPGGVALGTSQMRPTAIQLFCSQQSAISGSKFYSATKSTRTTRPLRSNFQFTSQHCLETLGNHDVEQSTGGQFV